MSNIDITNDGIRIWYSKKEKWSLWRVPVICVFLYFLMIFLGIYLGEKIKINHNTLSQSVLFMLWFFPYLYAQNHVISKVALHADFFFRETFITAEGISRKPRFGRPKHWSWNTLSGIDFRNGILRFEEGNKVRLYGRILHDMERVVSIVGPESRLAKAWKDYLANPQPDRGIIHC